MHGSAVIGDEKAAPFKKRPDFSHTQFAAGVDRLVSHRPKDRLPRRHILGAADHDDAKAPFLNQPIRKLGKTLLPPPLGRRTGPRVQNHQGLPPRNPLPLQKEVDFLIRFGGGR